MSKWTPKQIAEAKVYAQMFAWGWLTFLSEGHEDGTIDGNLADDITEGRMDEDFARLVQKMANHEADIIHRKMWKLRRKHGIK